MRKHQSLAADNHSSQSPEFDKASSPHHSAGAPQDAAKFSQGYRGSQLPPGHSGAQQDAAEFAQGCQSSQLPEFVKAGLPPSYSGAQQGAAQFSQGYRPQNVGYFSSLLNSTDVLQNPRYWEDDVPSLSQARIARQQMGAWSQVPIGNGGCPADSAPAVSNAARASGIKISGFHHKLLLNGKLVLDPYTLSVYNQASQEPQNGFPISYGSNSNVYNSMEKITGAVARDAASIQMAPVTPNKYNGVQDGTSLEERGPEHSNGGRSFTMPLKEGELPPSNTMGSWVFSQLETQQHGKNGGRIIDFRNLSPAPLAPVTPDKCKQLPDVAQSQIIDLVDDSETEGNGLQVVNKDQPVKGHSLALPNHGGSVQEDLPSCGIIEQPMQKLNQTGSEMGNKGIDLNKTPQQKPRRKKHRPKVIREGASARKAKPATPKPAGASETPQTKRKYTRRKESHANEMPSSGGESNNPAIKKARKSAKRVLHFESEEIQEEARNHSIEQPSLKKHGTQNHFEGTWITNGSSHGTHEVETNLCRVASDFEQSVQPNSNNHITSRETSLLAMLASRKEHLKQNLNKLALLRNNINNCDSRSALPTRLLPSHELTLNSQNISNGCTNSQFIGNGIDFRGLPNNYSCGNNDIQINYRNLIMGNPQLKKICSDVNNAKGDWLQSIGNKDNCTRGESLQRNSTDKVYMMLNKPMKENGGSNFSSTVPSFLSSSCRSGEKLSAPQMPEVLDHDLNFNFNGREMKQPPKAPIQVRNFSSLIGGISCGQLPSASKVPHLQSQIKMPINTEALLQTARPIKISEMQENKRQCPQVGANPVNSGLSCGNYDMVSSIRKDSPIEHRALPQNTHKQKTVQEGSPILINFDKNDQRSPHVRAKGRKLAPDRDPLEIIIHKMKYLCISDGVLAVASQEPQNALVPYSGSGTIVPYEGPNDLSKKKKPRPKVDLDQETNRVWLLLMGKEGDPSSEGKDLDKEKWWEEERRVFRGRVDSFIARMHLVQGDRRFSPWKGSVVDSVVGVFLTQNVSDHLSSSAFMSVAAKFPVCHREIHEEIEKKESVKIEDAAVTHLEMQNKPEATQCPGSSDRPQIFEDTKSLDSGTFLERTTDVGQSSCKSGTNDCLQKDRQFGVSVENSMQTSLSVTGSSLLTEDDEIRTIEFAPSSHSVISSQNSSDSPIVTGDRAAIITDLNSEIDDPLTKSRWNSEPYPSFMEMLQMVGTGNFEELTYCQGGRVASRHNIDSEARVDISESRDLDIMPSNLDRSYNLNDTYPCTNKSAFQNHPERNDHSGVSDILSSQFRTQPNSIVTEGSANETVRDISSMQTFSRDITSTNLDRTLSKTSNDFVLNTTDAGGQGQVVASSSVSGLQKSNFSEPSTSISNSNTLPSSQRNQIHECATSNQQNVVQALQIKEAGTIFTDQLPKYGNGEHLVPHTCCDAKLPPVSLNGQYTSEKQKSSKNNNNNNLEAPVESERQGSKTRKVRAEKDKKVIDWDSLRRANSSSTTKKERSPDRLDSVDWEAVRRADVSEISSTIRERGMNNMLSERIKDFLDRLVREHGSIDLEWLRDVPPDQAKDYLLSIRGLGLKSVECVRLLTLHHLAFPVDTNVGRICVRLGWVPLQPLPESLQLHLLEMYPLLETIQKYLWPRLCKLDQKTLYELHYQMITFGKVFCTKSKPNCNACPMRGECKHFASAFASARLSLPGPEEKGLVPMENPIASEPISKPVIVPMPVAQLEGLQSSQSSAINNCEPIIEEPATPEPEYLESLETDIEDAFYEDPDEIPVIKLNIEQFTQNLQNIMQGNMELLEGDMSRALVALTPEAASIPLPKLKNVNRLRTEHLVYELPDSHPLLKGLEKREPDDPCPYLLAIWTPGETAQSTEPPDITCSSRENGNLCDKKTCFACNSVREAQSQKVRGTLLIPVRTAMRGSFPLNGTYFQVNELFADHSSSLNPIQVPREWIWNLPRRTVYFGTSVPTIFRGIGTDTIQMCFWKGFICVRGFDRQTRAPRPLIARLHFPISKVMRNKRMPGNEDE